MSEWVKLEEKAPDFRLYGFHTGKKVMVRYFDGEEEETIYQGYGLFGDGISMFKPVSHWKESHD